MNSMQKYQKMRRYEVKMEEGEGDISCDTSFNAKKEKSYNKSYTMQITEQETSLDIYGIV